MSLEALSERLKPVLAELHALLEQMSVNSSTVEPEGLMR
jgi:hypothetical protein